MLKVTVVESRSERRLVVEGTLGREGVSELKSAWSEAKQAWGGRLVIDLSGMTSIDSSGQATLLGMICEGARLTARGPFNKYLASDLMCKAHLSFRAQYKPNQPGNEIGLAEGGMKGLATQDDKKCERKDEQDGNSPHIWTLHRDSTRRDDP